MTDIRTLGDAFDWLDALSKMSSDENRALAVQRLISDEREACVRIVHAYRTIMTSAQATVDFIEADIRARGK